MTTTQNEVSVKYLIAHYQQSIFSLALYLIGGDKNAAYDMTAMCFVKAFQATSLYDKDDTFFIKLASMVIEETRNAKIMPVMDPSDFFGLSPEKQKSLQVTKAALLALPFEEKAHLLLRDQLHLPYTVIAEILKTNDKNVRIHTAHARIALRKRIEEILRGAR